MRTRALDLLVTYNWGSIEWALANGAAEIPHIHIEDGFGPEESKRQFPRRVWTRRLALRRSIVVVPSLTLKEMAFKVWHLNKASVRYIPNGIEPREHFTTHLDDPQSWLAGQPAADRLGRRAPARKSRRVSLRALCATQAGGVPPGHRRWAGDGRCQGGS